MDYLSPRKISKNRRSGLSDYYSAVEEDDSDDGSLYLSCVEHDKENSILESANKSKVETPLHKKLLQKRLTGSNLTPRNKNNKRVSFNISNANWNVSEQVAKMQITETIQVTRDEQTVSETIQVVQIIEEDQLTADSSQSLTTDDENDTTVVAADPSAEVLPEPPVLETIQIPEIVVTESTVTNAVENVMKKIRLSQKRLSVAKPANSKGAARAQRMQLASEMNKRSATTTVKRRSSICLPRRTSIRRSIEKIKRIRELNRSRGKFDDNIRIWLHLSY